MSRTILRIFPVCICLLVTLLVRPSPALTRNGLVVMEFDFSRHPCGMETRLWIPYPVSNRYQLIENIHIRGNYDEANVYTDQTYGNSILFIKWAAGKKTRQIRFSFKIRRQEIKNNLSGVKQAPWSPADYALYLSGSSLSPVSGEVKSLALKITKKEKTVLGRAKAIYLWVCRNMYRDPSIRGCGNGDVCYLLRHRGGKCVDIHSVFVTLLRASGIPAREVFGLRIGKKGVTDITRWYHCWAEFYLPGHGWIVADPGDVLKNLLHEDLSPFSAKAGKYIDYFFGSVDPCRVRLSTGRDLILNPAQAGPKLNYFMYPYAEVGNKSLDYLDPKRFRYQITFKAIDTPTRLRSSHE